MTKANKLRELFPNYKDNPGIEVYEDDNSAKIVTYLNVSENRIEVMWTEWDEGIGEWHNGEIDGTTLDDVDGGVNEFDDEEFNLLIKGLK
tara:strand:- start:7346 stop:7615 length:270 start_codon:yes stop_codon:yes gene_type:complete